MLGLSNNRDEDWLTFVEDNAKTAREKGCKSIPFDQGIIDHFIKGKHIKPDPFNALFLYQLSTCFIKDTDYPFSNFNILEHKEVWKDWLKEYVNSENNESWAIKTDTLPKQFYHLLYQYHMIKENAHWISDSAKAEVQKIHDLKMPSSYFYELRDLINSL
jgi:hypothetical protein